VLLGCDAMMNVVLGGPVQYWGAHGAWPHTHSHTHTGAQAHTHTLTHSDTQTLAHSHTLTLGDTTPCRMTGVTLNGVSSPDGLTSAVSSFAI